MEMEEEVTSISDYLQILRRHKYLILIPILLLSTIGVIVAFILPPVYQSKATVLIEGQHIPKDLVQSTVVSLASERIRQIEQKIMTVDNISRIIKKYRLYNNHRKKMGVAELISEFKENTGLNLISAGRGRRSSGTMAFKISFNHKNPVLAQKITNEIVTLYLDANIKNRTARALETTVFLEEETEKFKQVIQEIEMKLALYKEKFKGSLPESLAINTASLNQIENGLQQLGMQGRMLNDRLSSIRAQLSSTSPAAIVRGGGQTSAPETKATLQAEYDYLLNKYSALHPDVKAVKRKIDSWVQGPTTDTSVNQENISNPVYLSLKNELRVTLLELQNVNRQGKLLQSKREKLEINVAKTPQVERGYYDLVRDLESHKAKYNELKSKSLQARLSQSLEEEQKAEKFSLIEPPVVPSKPIKPNRIKVVLMGFALAIGVGVGLGFLAEMLDSSLRGNKALEKVTGFEPLVVIPYIKTKEDLARTQKNKIIFLSVIFILFIVSIALVHFLYKPLDIIWFKVLHRISML